VTPHAERTDPARRGIRAAQIGMLLNAALAIIKLLTGLVGHSYALIADGIESVADIFSSLVVWGGLRIATRSADSEYPFGYGKAEALAAAIVALMLLGAAIGIAVESVREIMTPHHIPAPFTLAVLVGVMIVKEVLSRRVRAIGRDVGSTAVRADAVHHRADAITSAAAFVGISLALVFQWAPADDYAALLAATIIAYNGVGALRPAIADLMDRAPGQDLLRRVAAAATAVQDVRAIEKLKVRKVGMGYYVDLHVQAEPAMSLQDAHVLSGRVKSAIRDAVPEVQGALIHMEPFEGG
jgi:cation diffusion facilitator family transporter